MRRKDVRKVGDWELSVVARRTLRGRKYYVVGVRGGSRYWFHATPNYDHAVYFLRWVNPATTFHMRWV